MKVEFGYIDEIENVDELIDKSFNGTCFAYSWFLELKKSNKILKIYNSKNELQGFMPIFNSGNENKIFQSTMYIPYGGPVIFDVPQEQRNRIRYVRKIEKALCAFIKNNFISADFSIDDKIIDIMPFIRNDYIPEVRYTYKLDLKKGINSIYENFGHDRRKDIRKAQKRNIKFIIDNKMTYFDVNKAMKWEKKHNIESTSSFVEEYIKKTIQKGKGMCFVALDGDLVIGGVHLTWDKKNAYILYSFYEEVYDDVAIAYIYYNMIKYLIDNKIVEYLDFEGSVFETIEDWNISFGAYQSTFYNLHWNKELVLYRDIYNYGEK